MTEPSTGKNLPSRGTSPGNLALDHLLRPDFPRPRSLSGRGPATAAKPARLAGWPQLSEAVHLDPETYVPREIVPDEVLTRRNADRGRPHPIPNRPDPVPDEDEDGLLNDPGLWEFREELRECQTCGEPFLANAHNHKYCSLVCAREGRSFSRRCLECGEEFVTDRPEQVYCSLRCSGRAKRNPANDRRCRECDVPFRATRPQQVFCSRACAWAWRKRENRR